MGSGKSDFYSGIDNSGSQPYAPTYNVLPQMMELDKTNPNIYDPQKGYFLNPLAVKIQDAIEHDQIQMNGRSAMGEFTYVLDLEGNIVFAKRFNPNKIEERSPHPTLIGGKNPEVQCAGMIHLYKGRIVWYNNKSGHFKPNYKSLDKVDVAIQKLREQNPKIFAKTYTGRIDYGK